MIAVTLVYARLHVALTQRNDLRGACLSCKRIGRTRARASGSAAGPGNVDKRLLDPLQAVGLERDCTQVVRHRALQLVRVAVLYVLHEMGTVHFAVCCDYRHAMRKLHGCRDVIPLANAHGDGVAGEPFLLETPHLPFLRREYAHSLTLDVDARALAETELADEVENIVDAELVGEPVVVGVARDHEGPMQIDRPMAALFPV